jgi:hypothetical protein
MTRGGGGSRGGGGGRGFSGGGRGFSGGRGGARGGYSGGRGISGSRAGSGYGRRGGSSYRDRYNRRPWSNRRRNVVNNYYGYGGYGYGDGYYGYNYPLLYDAWATYYPTTTVVQNSDSYCDVSYVSDINDSQYKFNQCTTLAETGGTPEGREATLRVCRNTLNQDLSIAQASYGACKAASPVSAYTSPYLSFY